MVCAYGCRTYKTAFASIKQRGIAPCTCTGYHNVSIMHALACQIVCEHCSLEGGKRFGYERNVRVYSYLHNCDICQTYNPA